MFTGENTSNKSNGSLVCMKLPVLTPHHTLPVALAVQNSPVARKIPGFSKTNYHNHNY